MSTDLQAALREAAADVAFEETDLRAVVHEGTRRVRRRTAARVGVSALAVMAVTVLVTVGFEGQGSDPQPADVVRLDIQRAEDQPLDVLASVRTTAAPTDDLDSDRFDGITSDGLVLRSRYTYKGNRYQLGLLDPRTGATDWLPGAPQAEESVVDLSADRLVLFSRPSPGRLVLSTYDRSSGTWSSAVAQLPPGLEVHVPPRVELGADGRVYIGSTSEGESGPMRWWSIALPSGGEARPETELEGQAVAWAGGMRVTADGDGRVVVSESTGDTVVAEGRPSDCTPPSDPDLADLPVRVGIAGDRPVVTYWCGDVSYSVTMVYDADGGSALEIRDAGLLATADGQVLLGADLPEIDDGLYLLDLDRRTLARIAPGPHDAQVGMADGLVLWNQPGPIDDKRTYDVIWRVGRLPLGD